MKKIIIFGRGCKSFSLRFTELYPPQAKLRKFVSNKYFCKNIFIAAHFEIIQLYLAATSIKWKKLLRFLQMLSINCSIFCVSSVVMCVYVRVWRKPFNVIILKSNLFRQCFHSHDRSHKSFCLYNLVSIFNLSSSCYIDKISFTSNYQCEDELRLFYLNEYEMHT